MERSIMEMEVNHQKIDSPASTPRPLGMLIRINSIAIDLSMVAEEDTQEHEHFSIRGYVAGTRKKDRKLCLPFASQANGGDLEENLPPLYVPRFRWWECLNCVSDIGTETSSEEIMMEQSPVPLNKEKKNIGTNSPTRDGVKDILLPSRCKQARNTEIGDQAVALHIQTTFAGDKHGPDGFGNSRNCSHVNDIANSNPCSTARHPAKTCSKSGANVMDKEGRNLSFDTTEPNPHQAQETHTNTADAIKSRDIDIFEPKNLRNDIGDISDKAVNADTAHAIGLLSVEVDGHENASSGSDNKLSGLPHKRKPKLRYLAEIMDGERISVNDHTKLSASSSGMHAVSAELGAVSSPQEQEDFLEHDGKGIRSAQRKRKITREENKRPPEISYPSSSAKKSGASKVNPENRSVEISDSQSEGGASTQLDLQIGMKSRKIKLGKSKDLVLSKKKSQIHVDEELSLPVPELEVPKIISVVSTDLPKYNIPTLSGQMEPLFRSSQSTQQTVLNSNLSNNKRSEVEAGHDVLMAPKNSKLGECLVKEKVALDLSLNSFMSAEINDNDQSSIVQQKGIHSKGPQRKEFLWDLNEIITHKTTMLGEKQFSTLLDNDCLPLHKNLDISSSCRKEKAGEGQWHPGVSAPQTDRETDKSIELGASDDIPMDIVELMAKNQHERALGNSKKYILPEETYKPVIGFPAIHCNGCPGTTNFPLSSTRSKGIVLASDNVGAIQDSPISFPLLNTNQFHVGKPEENQSRFFSSFPQNQPSKMQFSASGSNIMGSRLGEGAKTMWPPRRENIPTRMHSFSDQQHKGKTVSDIKGGDMENIALRDTLITEQGIIEPSRKSVGSLDPYSNDTIPAMQLLSLMDRGMKSSSFNVSAKEFIDKPFSPCNHHPRFNGEENQSLINRSLFSQQHHSKDLVWLRSGVRSAGESSKKPTSSLNCQMSAKCLEQENSGRQQKSESSKCALHAIRDSCFGTDKQKTILGTSSPMVFPQQSHRYEGPSVPMDLEAPNKLSNRQMRINSEMVLCTLNRNPAEFSIPDSQNKYTIGAKDLKFRKMNVCKERPRSVKVNEQKRQRVTKDASAKKYARK
ncbi:protein EMBRYONIC FLOWER 1-like [Forsythia ovata]|uniref:Protein EMBRYONIC FLOWER 1-like n=1 Tax=Forsythia ovata TaxID=205694 RepID=A0ABD1WFP2_9LAMI